MFRKKHLRFVNSNKISEDQVNLYLLQQADKIVSLQQQHHLDRHRLRKKYASEQEYQASLLEKRMRDEMHIQKQKQGHDFIGADEQRFLKSKLTILQDIFRELNSAGHTVKQ